MKKIIAIIGPSGAGKTELSIYMKERFGIPVVCSYTTRPIRDGEKNGREHIFVSESDIPDKSEMIAYTEFGGYKYWATKQQIENDITLYVIDEDGYFNMKETLCDVDIKVVYISRNNIDVDAERKKRDINRKHIDKGEISLYIENNYQTLDMFLFEASSEIIKFLLYASN